MHHSGRRKGPDARRHVLRLQRASLAQVYKRESEGLEEARRIDSRLCKGPRKSRLKRGPRVPSAQREPLHTGAQQDRRRWVRRGRSHHVLVCIRGNDGDPLLTISWPFNSRTRSVAEAAIAAKSLACITCAVA